MVRRGGKPTQFFCGVEKSNSLLKTIHKIIKDDGSEITNQKLILNEVKAFYEYLYKSNDNSSNSIDNNSFFNDLINSLIVLWGNIKRDEATAVLKNMKNNRSPGTSGFSADFYKVFWNRISHFVVRALNETFNEYKPSDTQTQGLITCIPKGDKP